MPAQQVLSYHLIFYHSVGRCAKQDVQNNLEHFLSGLTLVILQIGFLLHIKNKDTTILMAQVKTIRMAQEYNYSHGTRI